MEIKGVNGQVHFDGQYVTITRKGFLARASIGKGEKRLHISQITALQWKPAGALVNGYLQFTIPGGVERRSKFGKQTPDAIRDENSIIFTKQQQPQFEHLRAALDDAIARRHAPQPASAQGAGFGSIADELAKLAALRDQGVISVVDFEAGKRKLLGN